MACRNNLEVLMLSGTRGPDAGNSNTTAWGAMAEIKEARPSLVSHPILLLRSVLARACL